MRVTHQHRPRKLGGKPAYPPAPSDTFTCQRCGITRRWNPTRAGTKPDFCRDCH